MFHKILRKLVGISLILAISFASLDSVLAAAGALDLTFDLDGKVTTAIGSGTADDQGYAITVQPDGKIIVAGGSDQGSIFVSNYDFALVRYNSDGSLDAPFHADGKVTTNFGNSDEGSSAIALQPDGKIIVAGSTDLNVDTDVALVRYNSNGSLDTTFDTDGILTTDFGSTFIHEIARAVMLQPDGKIVMAGVIEDLVGNVADVALARYNSNGSLDLTFDIDGKVITDFGSTLYDAANDIVLQPDGKIVVAGITEDILSSTSDIALARYGSDGSLDITFDTDGKVITDFGGSRDVGSAVALQADGKIVVAGGSNLSGSIDFALARYNSDGSLDTSFDTDGLVTTTFDNVFFDAANAVTLQPDGKIVAAGTSNSDFAVARYDVASPAMEVSIDVKPRRFPNRIELEDDLCKDDDNLYVAILTTPTFDALTVDVSSIKLGDPILIGTATPIRSRIRDVDGDGDQDLVLVFSLCDLVTNGALDTSTTELVLTGTTLVGVTITGKDSVIVVHDDD